LLPAPDQRIGLRQELRRDLLADRMIDPQDAVSEEPERAEPRAKPKSSVGYGDLAGALPGEQAATRLDELVGDLGAGALSLASMIRNSRPSLAR
jgi:hypothetical protein